MIWLAERFAALVAIIIGSQILLGVLRNWWQSHAWLRTAMVFVLNAGWQILAALALLVFLSTPIGWIALFLDWRKRHMAPNARSPYRPLSLPDLTALIASHGEKP
jgi:hypothetical protein